MSYARFGCDGSDVYIIGTVNGGRNCIECVGCHLAFESNPEWDEWCEAATPEERSRAVFAGPPMFRPNGQPYLFDSYTDALAHLEAHRQVGEFVPEDVDEEFRDEMALDEADPNRWVPNVDAGTVA